MACDLYVIRIDDWLNAAEIPINKREVDHLIESDYELEWSTLDYVFTKPHEGRHNSILKTQKTVEYFI